jgi:outer membrane receptor protein involved in Fe transport
VCFEEISMKPSNNVVCQSMRGGMSAARALALLSSAALPVTAWPQQDATARADAAANAELPVIPVSGAPATDAAPEPQERESGGFGGIDEVVVTSAYREQKAQDLVGSSQVFGGKALDEKGAAGLKDFLLEVPSVSFEPSGNGSNKITMRGISNVNASDLGYAGGSPTTGIYVNDVAVQGSGVFPDLDIYDLQRIEVLKGPQGTLYGEGSMGGSIRMVTNDPNLHQWQLRTQGSLSNTTAGSPSGYFRAAVNVPIVDDALAARIVGNVRHTGGYVDYTGRDEDDANSVDHQTARAVVRYVPAEALTLDYTLMYDNEDRKQFPVVDVGKIGRAHV